MWMTKPVYESLPFVYMILGVLVGATAFLAEQTRWQAVCVGTGMVLMTGGLVLWLKRRDYRSSRSRKPFEKIV
jgi:hypothetical protein